MIKTMHLIETNGFFNENIQLLNKNLDHLLNKLFI